MIGVARAYSLSLDLPMACGLPRSLWADWVIMGLVAAIDDSGTDGGKVYVLGGLMATADAWEGFSEEWREALDAHNPKRIEFLKMKQANAREGQFAGFNDGERDAKLQSLALIAKKYAIFAQVAAVRRDDFKLAFQGLRVGRWIKKGTRRERKALKPMKAYDLLFHKIIKDGCNFVLDAGLSGPLDYVFDCQGKAGRLCADAYERIAPDFPGAVQGILGGPPGFRDDKKFVPLQAADAVSWIWRRHLATEEQGDSGAVLGNPFTANLHGLPMTLTVFTPAELAGYRAFLEDHARLLP